jgi:O-antigen/teichoic acid export membrane protein
MTTARIASGRPGAADAARAGAAVAPGPHDDGPRSDVTVLARRSMLTLVGGVASGLLGFLAVFVVSHGLGTDQTGRFFEGVSLFSIASSVLVLGADIALMRFIAHDRVGTGDRIRSLLRIALVPVAAISVVAAGIGFVAAPQLANLLVHERAADLTTYLRTLMVALPVAAVYTAAISATRAFGTVKPFVFIDKIAKPLAQVLLLVAVVVGGFGVLALAGAWVLPIVGAFLGTGVWLWRRVRAAEPSDRSASDLVATFWRFALPRGLAGVFQVLILWLDTLLIGLFRPPGEVAIYVASTRYVLLVLFVGNAVTQAIAPQLGDMLARRETGRAESVYRTATVWNILVTWPMLVTLAVFAPVVLHVFGSAYGSGSSATRVLAASMLIATAVGPVDWILLMAGKSSWNLLNTALALVLNIALNLLLIPRLGIVGAAIAWGISVVVSNVAPLIEVMMFVRISPFAPAHRRVSVTSLLCFGVPGMIAVALFGQSFATMVGATAIALGCYVAVLWPSADALGVRELAAAVRPSRHDAERRPSART